MSRGHDLWGPMGPPTMERRAEVNAALWRSGAESTPAHDTGIQEGGEEAGWPGGAQVEVECAAREPAADGRQGAGAPYWATPPGQPLRFTVGDGQVRPPSLPPPLRAPRPAGAAALGSGVNTDARRPLLLLRPVWARGAGAGGV